MQRDRNQKTWTLAILTACLVACGTLRADDYSGESLLTVGRLFGTKEFDTESLPVRRWSKRTSTYFTLEKPSAGTGSDVVRTDPATGKKEVVVPATAFVSNYGSKHINEKPLAVAKATLSIDGKTVRLDLPNLAPTWGMEIKYRLTGTDGRSLTGVIHNTIHELKK